jgi:hypothetical protein
MRSIRYGLHFSLLIVAAFIFWLLKDVHFPVWFSDFNSFHYGLMGVLHATALVVSLRERKANHPIATLCFIALASVWSAATPILGLWGSVVWIPIRWTPLAEILRSSDFGFVLFFLTGSAIGAAGYWLLVRLFWLKSLGRADCLRTVALCVAATLLVTVASHVVSAKMDFKLKRPEVWANGSELLVTVAWWFAFSLSLYWSENRTKAPSREIAFTIAAFVLALGLVMWLLVLSSSPLNRVAQADAARLSDLKTIAGALHFDWEHAQDKSLAWKAPAALKDLPTALGGIREVDPATGSSYEYMPLSGSMYGICAVFDSDSSAQNTAFTSKGWTFTKGRHCFTLDASNSPY